MTNPKRYDRMTGVFASDGFLEDSLFNEQNPNILLKKLQARKTTRRISQLFNRRGSNEDEQEIGEVENNTSFGIHRIEDTLSDSEEVVENENVHIPETQPNSSRINKNTSQNSYLDVLPRNNAKKALSMRQLSPVNIETDEDSSNISNKRRKSSVTHIPPPAQFAGNDSDREKFRNEIPIEIDSDPESAPTSSNFKKPAFVPKPLPRNIVPKANSNNSLRRMLFKEGVSNPANVFVCSTPINSHQILHFDRTLPFSPISKTRVGTPRPPVYSSPYKKTHAAPLLVDLDQQEHHVTSSQPTPTEKQSNTLPRPEITSPRSISKFDRFQQIRSKEIISTNLEQEIRIQNVYQTPKATRKSSFVSPVNISPIRTTRRSPVEDPEDMELPVLPINASNRDILMEVDQQTNHKPTAQKTVRRNTTNYESNIEETPMRAANHASLRSAAKAVQARLAIVEISEDEEEAVGDQNISEDQSNEIEGNKNNNNPGYETIDNAGQKLKPSQDVHPEASIVTRRQTHSFKEKTIEPQAKQRSKESYEDGSDSSESVQSTRSDEGVGGLPLVPTFERLASTFVVRQETFHLPAKKRKKPQNATQETLDYLNLTNKAKKKSRDQSLGVSKRTLYSQEMDDDKTDSDSTFKAPTMGARRRLRSSSENEPQAVERSSNSKNLPEKSSHQISEEPIKKSSRISRSSKNVVLTRSQSSTDEEIPETETVPVEVVQKQVAKKPAQKSVESSDSDVESVNKLPKNKKSTISQPFMRQKYARIVQPETCDKEMTEKEYRMTPVKIVLQRLSTTESCQKTVRPSSEEDLPANQRNDDNLSDTFQSPSSVSSFASEVATPVKNKSLNKETAHSEKSSNIIEIVAANNFQEQSQVKKSNFKKKPEKVKPVKEAKKTYKKSVRLVEETPQDRDSDVTLIEEPEVTGLRRSKREHKLTNMWWSVKNNDVRVRFGIMDIKHAKRELVQKKNTTFHNKPKLAGISSFVHRQPKLFAICDQLVDENFRGITNPDKYFRKELKKDSQKKKSIYKRIQLAADESSEDEMPSKLTEIIISKEKKKKSVQEQKKSKPTENASKVDKVPLKRKHREREEEHQEIEHNNELVSDYLREVSKSGRKNKSLLRGPKCKRRSLTPVHEEQDDHFGDNDDCEPPMQHETTIKPVSEFVTTLTSIPTTTINAEPTTWRNNGGEISSTKDLIFVDCGNGISFGRFYSSSLIGVMRFEPMAMRGKARVKHLSNIFFVLSGELVFTINGEIMDAKAGDCVKVDHDQYYEILNPSEDTQAVVQFSNASTDSNNSTATSSSSLLSRK